MTTNAAATAEPHGPALELRGVVKKFGETTIVDGLDFQVGRGEVMALLGPNGAGKTTTIEMCEGFTTPSAGSIQVLGISPDTEPDRLRSRIGIMLQGGGSYSGIRVEEMLRLAASYHAHPHDPAWLLDVVGLTKQRRTTWRRLSGGQQQRLSLALALIGRPELVFLDEPTAGMDAQSRHLVWQLIGQLRADGVTVVVTTHLMDEAEALADRVIIIDRGRIVAEGTPAELTSQRSSGASRMTFVTDAPIAVAACERALTSAGDPLMLSSSRPLTYHLDGRIHPELLVGLTTYLAQEGITLRELKTGNRNLEDVFLDLTGREMRK